MLRTALVALLSFATANASLACTAINVVATDGSVVAARTMEWAFDFKWTLVNVPRGTELSLTAPADLNLPAKTLRTRYAVVGVKPGVFDGTFFIDGQNEAGLGMSANFFPGFAGYQTVTAEDTGYVSIFDFAVWALGGHGTVEELRTALAGTKVWWDGGTVDGTPPDVHFVFTDRSGASIVVEFVDGEQRIHDNVAQTLTNSPTYDWHISNVRNYLNLTATGVAEVPLSGAPVTAIGQGGGLLGIPGDYTPPGRFVRVAYLNHFGVKPTNVAEAKAKAIHVLNTVDIPLGTVRSQEGGKVAMDHTQWIAVKDLTNNVLQIADYANRGSFLTIDLADIFDRETSGEVLVTALPYPQPVAGRVALPGD